MEWNWILEEYDDMVYVSDLNNYELLYVNRAGLDMFHLSREELFSGKKATFAMRYSTEEIRLVLFVPTNT